MTPILLTTLTMGFGAGVLFLRYFERRIRSRFRRTPRDAVVITGLAVAGTILGSVVQAKVTAGLPSEAIELAVAGMLGVIGGAWIAHDPRPTK